MSESNGNGASEGATLELGDTVVVETQDAKTYEFEVVGIVEGDNGKTYAVCYSEALDTTDEDEEEDSDDESSQPFIVTDGSGNIITDLAEAQGILEEFLTMVAQEEEGGDNSTP